MLVVSSVKSMNMIFEGTGYNAKTFYLNISNWDVSNVVI